MKRNTVISVIFIITTILATVIAIYINVTSSNNIQQLESEISNLKNQIQNNTEIENEEVNTQTTPTTFNPTKAVNNSNEYINTFFEDINGGFNVSVENGIPKITLSKANEETKEIKINQINEKIIDVCGGSVGDGANGYIAFLTENGDVYLSNNIYNLLPANTTNYSLTLTKVENISNICTLRKITCIKEITFGNEIRKNPYWTIVAIDSTRNSYDLIYKD